MMDWKLFALASAFFAGLTAIFSKVGVEQIPSNLATLYRTVLIALFLIGLIAVRGEWRNPALWPSRTLIFLALSALATGLSWICYYRALQLGPASLVSPIDKLSLVIAVLLAVAFLGERLTAWQWTGAGCMAFGALLLAIK